MKSLSKYFVSGLLFLLPLVIIYQLILIIASTVRTFFEIYILVDFVIALVVIAFIGFIIVRIFKKYLKRRMVKWVESGRWYALPLSFFLHIDEAGNRAKKSFTQPILYKVDSGIYKIGYITDDSTELLFKDNSSMPETSVWVYAPFPVNFFGDFLLIQKSNIQKVDPEAAGSLPLFILSGGLLR